MAGIRTIIARAEDFDYNKVKEFYDPHPLIWGGIFPAVFVLPPQVAETAKKLDGQTMSVYEAGWQFVNIVEGIIYLDMPKNRIYLEMHYDHPYDAGHSFVLIKFR